MKSVFILLGVLVGSTFCKGNTATRADRRTIIAPDEIDIDEDASRLRKAMKGWGTDENTLINILTSRYYNDRLSIARKFEDKYDKDLWKDIHSETSGDFRTALKALVMTEAQFLAEELYNAMKGWGTNEDTLINVLLMTLNDYDTMQGIKNYYENLYDETLQERIEDETSGPLKQFLVDIINRPRFDSEVNKTLVVADVANLKDYINGKELTDIINLLTNRSIDHIKALREAYYQDEGTSNELENDLDLISGHHIHDGLINLISACRDPVYYLAYELQQSMKGRGTDERTLTRIIATRADKDLAAIKEMYKKINENIELKDDVKDDTSRDYRKTLLGLIN